MTNQLRPFLHFLQLPGFFESFKLSGKQYAKSMIAFAAVILTMVSAYAIIVSHNLPLVLVRI